MGEDLSRIKNELQGSPLFQLSLTNKELFHSNFLAWFGNNYKEEFKELVNRLLGQGTWPNCVQDFFIVREYDHFDICVRELNNRKLGNPRIVIENKVKSIPTKKQLDDYKQKNSVKNCDLFILLTMTSMETPKDWKIITYKQLSKELKTISLGSTYHNELLKDYCDYVANLQRVIEHFDDISSYYSTDDEDELMKELGIHDLCGKRKIQTAYNNLVDILTKKGYNVVSKESDLTTDNIMVGWGFTNSPLIEVKLKSEYGDDIIIQIQDKQYRHAVEYFDETIGNRIKKTTQPKNKKKPNDYGPSDIGLQYLLDRYSYIFSSFDGNCQPRNYPFEPDNKQFGQTDGYCKYCNGNQIKGKISCFVYQWIEIPSINMDNLVDYIVVDTNMIIENTRNKSIQKQ